MSKASKKQSLLFDLPPYPQEKKKPVRRSVTTFDLISSYAAYADVIEAPKEAHEAVAISLLGAILNPNVLLAHGAIDVPLDLWVLLLSGSGLGRNTIVNLARPILERANLQNLLCKISWGSGIACQQSFAENPYGLFVWPEISSVLKKLNSKNFGEVKEWITDRYDNLTLPEAIRYRETGKRSDTPPIIFDQAPRLNFLATSSEAWFLNSIRLADAAGGFVPRWLLFRLKDPKRRVPIPRKTDSSLIDPLAKCLRRAGELKGVADLSRVEALYERWYAEASGRYSLRPDPALATAFFNRARTHVLKLAVIFEVSRSLSLKVTPEAMVRAMEFAGRAEQSLEIFLETGFDPEGAEVKKMAERVKAAGSSGLTRSELTRAFQHVRASMRESRLCTLLEAETLRKVRRGTTGRPVDIFVHKDYAVEPDSM